MHQAGDPLDIHIDVRMMERVYVVNGDESMLRGIRFVCDADGVRYFFSDCVVLLNDMSHDWYIDDTELNHYCFREGRFTGAQFDSACLSLSNLSFARLRRYPGHSPIDRIDTYDDFIHSCCQTLILFYDGGYLDIYEKDRAKISMLYDKIVGQGFTHVMYIDDKDPRDRMGF